MKKFLKNLSLAILFLISILHPVQAGEVVVTDDVKQYPSEYLATRLNRIAKDFRIEIAFDGKSVEGISLPAIEKENTAEKALTSSLLNTSFIYRKNSENNYSIVKRTNTRPSSGSATLRGRIVESETSEPIPGAAIHLSDKQYAVSDFNGYYSFPKVTSGKVVLEVSYVGFKPEKTEITVKTGENTYDIKMSGSTQLSEVLVKGVLRTRSAVPHTTEKLMVAEIKGLNVLASGISSEQISKSADRNAAEAVQRVSGVSIADDKFVIVRGLNQRYNLTYMNDNVAPSTEMYSRAFALDLIPSRIIDKILVFKSPSPENQADATGGVIKIYTKDAKVVRHFDVELQLGYRPGTTFKSDFLTYNGGKFDFLGFDDGTRKLPSSVPGYGNLDQATISQKEYVRTFSPILTYGQKTALPNLQFTANYYNSFVIGNKYLSMLSSLSYKHEDLHSDVFRQEGNPANGTNDKVYNENRNTETGQINLLQNFTYQLNDSSKLEFKNFLLEQGQNTTLVRISHPNFPPMTQGGYYDPTYQGPLNKNNILSWSQRFLYAGNLGGTHYFNKGVHELQWNLGYTFSRFEVPDERVIRLSTVDQSERSGDPSLQWTGVPRQGDYDLSTVWGMISRTWTRNTEGVYNASADYTYKPVSWIKLKTGMYQQFKLRKLSRRAYLVNEGDLRGGYMDFMTTVGNYGDYIDTKAVFFKEQDLNKLWSDDYLRDNTSGLKVYDRTLGSDAYTASEQNNSGYLAVDYTPNKQIEVYGGVRAEYDRTKIGGALPPAGDLGSTGINVPIIVDYQKLDWLPSLNINYRPFESTVFRLGYGKTVNRPEIREAAPYADHDYVNNNFVSGNPALRPSSIDNYDVRIEFYPRHNRSGEVISLGLFYKDLQNPIERINNTTRQKNAYPIISFQNSDHAVIKGAELELRKNMDFIPVNFFRSFSFVGNVTLIQSRARRKVTSAYDQGVDVDRPLQGQAPYIVNAGLYYDNAGSGSKVSVIYNVTGTSIYAAGRPYQTSSNIDGPLYRGSILELPRNLLDFSVTQRLFKGLQCKFSIQNLLNKPVEMAEDWNFTNKYELQSISYNDNGTRSYNGDPISYHYNPGRYYVFNLTYSF